VCGRWHVCLDRGRAGDDDEEEIDDDDDDDEDDAEKDVLLEY
jgi:hypothetical protein